MIELVGFDGDDTLWRSEDFFHAAGAEFEAILGQHVTLDDARIHEQLLAAERRNIALFGYGAKGMTLSMIETAIALAGAALTVADIAAIVDIGKRVLAHPVELLPGICAAVAAVAADFRVVLITKGDLFHQERKVRDSGLAALFQRIEIVSEKDPATYRRVLDEVGVAPANFVMVGNSLRSDIAPVLALGGSGVHVPYHVTWAMELDHDADTASPRLLQVDAAAAIPAAVRELAARLRD
ncbi:MAG TPA: HAD family hydrolase [Rhodanobacteraceae bacterium]|nr:HAD family hydrolase [Rhodanobacteraceae bacterium]